MGGCFTVDESVDFSNPMRVAISGIRNVSRRDLVVIENAISRVLADRPSEIIFGGARGTDTVALAAACAVLQGKRPPKLVVVVPKRVRDQPISAQDWIRECADEVVELQAARLNTEAYRRRNKQMVSRADLLLAFWDGRSTGTRMTIGLAEDAGIPVEIIPLAGESGARSSLHGVGSGPTKRDSPWPHWSFRPTPTVGMPMVAFGFYMAAAEGLDRLSQFVRATKGGMVSPKETRYWANVVAQTIEANPELREAKAIVPIPRRRPGAPNDMAQFIQIVSSETGKLNGTDLLVRVEEPGGGELRAYRERFTPEEHQRTMAVDLEHLVADRLEPGSRVILLDNVVTYGGTLEGARQAWLRDVPEVEPTGVTLLSSGDYSVTL